MKKVSRKEWRARYRAEIVERQVAEEEKETARAWAKDAEQRLEEALARWAMVVRDQVARIGELESEVNRQQAQFRNVLRALGPDRPNWEIGTEALNKARRICRGELP